MCNNNSNINYDNLHVQKKKNAAIITTAATTTTTTLTRIIYSMVFFCDTLRI